MKGRVKTYRSVQDFGRSLGLSNLEMELIRQKRLLIVQLKEARMKKGLSQAAVAKLLGSKQPAVARMEAGQVSQVSMDFLFKAALVLGLPVVIKPTKMAA